MLPAFTSCHWPSPRRAALAAGVDPDGAVDQRVDIAEGDGHVDVCRAAGVPPNRVFYCDFEIGFDDVKIAAEYAPPVISSAQPRRCGS